MSTCSYTWMKNGWETASVPIIAMGKQRTGVPYPFLYISIQVPDATLTNTDFVQVTLYKYLLCQLPSLHDDDCVYLTVVLRD